MKPLQKTIAFCCAVLFFTSGCTTKVDIGGENDQTTATEKETAEVNAKKGTDSGVIDFDIACDGKTEAENISLCATYVKNSSDVGYTVYLTAELENGAEFVTEASRVDAQAKKRVIVVRYGTGQENTTEYNDTVVIKANQVSTELQVEVQLHDDLMSSNPAKEKDDKDIKRKVVLTRANGIIGKQTALAGTK